MDSGALGSKMELGNRMRGNMGSWGGQNGIGEQSEKYSEELCNKTELAKQI